jgi:hypothetical protein
MALPSCQDCPEFPVSSVVSVVWNIPWFMRGFRLVWNGLEQAPSGFWCPTPRNEIMRISRKH